MGKPFSLKSPPKQILCKILKCVLFKILQSSLFIRHYATNPAPIQENLATSPRFCWRFEKYTDVYKRQVRETGTFFNDQAHIVYVNSQIKDETALGKLMHDFFCTNSKDMNYSILAQRVRYFKEDTKGVAAMCRAMEKMRDETEHETSVKHALAMLADGVPCEKVAKYTDLSIEEVRALAEKKSA